MHLYVCTDLVGFVQSELHKTSYSTWWKYLDFYSWHSCYCLRKTLAPLQTLFGKLKRVRANLRVASFKNSSSICHSVGLPGSCPLVTNGWFWYLGRKPMIPRRRKVLKESTERLQLTSQPCTTFPFPGEGDASCSQIRLKQPMFFRWFRGLGPKPCEHCPARGHRPEGLT